MRTALRFILVVGLGVATVPCALADASTQAPPAATPQSSAPSTGHPDAPGAKSLEEKGPREEKAFPEPTSFPRRATDRLSRLNGVSASQPRNLARGAASSHLPVPASAPKHVAKSGNRLALPAAPGLYRPALNGASGPALNSYVMKRTEFAPAHPGALAAGRLPTAISVTGARGHAAGTAAIGGAVKPSAAGTASINGSLIKAKP